VTAEDERRLVTVFNPPELSQPVGFAHAAEAGGFIWLGGQIGSDASGRVPDPGDLVAQFERALRNLVAALDAAGSRPRNIVKITYYVTDVASYRAALNPIGAAYGNVLGRHYPASTLVEVSGLFDPDAMVEIECVAIRDQTGR